MKDGKYIEKIESCEIRCVPEHDIWSAGAHFHLEKLGISAMLANMRPLFSDVTIIRTHFCGLLVQLPIARNFVSSHEIVLLEDIFIWELAFKCFTHAVTKFRFEIIFNNKHTLFYRIWHFSLHKQCHILYS